MNELIFSFRENKVRIVEVNGEPWFVAKDVCDVLEINNPSQAISRLDDDEKNTIILNEGIGNPNKSVVSEHGLYNLIFSSRKPEAKEFKRWVTHEVLPTIRKNGIYATDAVIEKTLEDPDYIIGLLTRLKAERAEKEKLQQQNLIMQPKAEYYDELVDRNLLTNLRDTAKELKVTQTQFINFLLSAKYVYRDNNWKLKPYSQYTPALFELKEWTRHGKADLQTMVTLKGREKFRALIQAQKMTV